MDDDDESKQMSTDAKISRLNKSRKLPDYPSVVTSAHHEQSKISASHGLQDSAKSQTKVMKTNVMRKMAGRK